MRNSAERGLSAQIRTRRWTEADARRVVEAWEGSGESGTGFGKRLGLVPQRLYWWRDRLRKIDRKAARAQSKGMQPVMAALVPVAVRDADCTVQAGGTPIVVEADLGLVVKVSDVDATTAAWVAVLARVLRGVP